LAPQTDQVYDNLRAALSAVGAGLGDIAKVVTDVVDLSPGRLQSWARCATAIWAAAPIQPARWWA
jgi:hypothetical protein